MKELKNVLIISYYWPPSGGVGVQRWLKMTKYFHQFDLKPIVYTPLNGEFPGYDANLEKEMAEALNTQKLTQQNLSKTQAQTQRALAEAKVAEAKMNQEKVLKTSQVC